WPGAWAAAGAAAAPTRRRAIGRARTARRIASHDGARRVPPAQGRAATCDAARRRARVCGAAATARRAVSHPENELGSPSGLPGSPFPLRRFEETVRCPAVRRRPAVSSREVGGSPECYEQQGCERIGLPAPTMAFLFPGSLRGLTFLPAPVPLRDRVHPLLSFSSSSEFQPLRTCPAPRCEDAFLGVSFPIATSGPGVHLRASIPISPYGPPSAFLTLSTVCSSSSLAGLFHPAATSGIHLSGASSRCQAGPPRRRPVPSCRWRPSPAAELPRRLQLQSPRLQGLDPGSDPRTSAGVFSSDDASKIGRASCRERG